MNRIYFIILLVLSLALSGFDSIPKGEQKPNVVFILADDLGWKDLSVMGSDYYETPNIDRLAKQGVLFTNAYAASPLCSPTRASILTGQEPGRLRFTTPSGHVPNVVLDPREKFEAPSHFKTATPETRTRLPNKYLTYAEVLKEHGYTTAFMGKWHLGREPYLPENQGFDVVVGGREHPGPPGPGHYFSPWNIETLPPVPKRTHIADELTKHAIDFIRNNKDKPFLLNLWYYDVHAPYQAKEDLKKKYQKKLSPEHIQRSPTMGAMIETLDTNVGKVMAALEEQGLAENTIVIFTSDNGGNMYDGPDHTTPTNNYPLRAGKGSNYEGGVRVPLIVKVPGSTRPGTVSNVVTSTVDHYPTLLELLDIPFPDDLFTDGVSFVPALKGEFYNRPPNYSTFNHNVVATGNRANISMRHGPWKLYKFYYDGKDREHRYELYNLGRDIGENHDLSELHPERVKSMAAQLKVHAEEAGILLPNKNKNYKGNTAGAWIGSNDTKIGVSDNILHINAVGASPHVETFYTPNIKDGIYYLEFEMKSNSRGDGTVAWQTAGESEYKEKNMMSFKAHHDSLWHSYKVKVPLTGRLKIIKITPSQGKGEIKLKNIHLVNEEGYYIREWPMHI